MAFRAPLLGYNTNVRHKGKLYHIQTEDSGIDHPHVITHLFADGGRIVASKKTSYAERVGSDGLPDQVKKLMQGQHKAMFISLRDGIFDEEASDEAPERSADPPLPQPATPELRVGEQEPPGSSAEPPSGSVRLDGANVGERPVPAASELRSREEEPRAADLRSRAEEPRAADLRSRAEEPRAADLRSRAEEPRASTPPTELDETDIELQPDPSEEPGPERAPLRQAVPAALRLEASPGGPLTSLRPRAEDPEVADAIDGARAASSASQSGGGPRSLFGGDLLSDKSLDEVILNYLATNEKDG